MAHQKIESPFDGPEPERPRGRDVIDSETREVVDEPPRIARELGFLEAMWQMFKDPKAEWFAKLLALAAIAYLVFPLDLIPDVIPAIGLSDDLVALLTALASLVAAVQRYAAENTDVQPDGTRVVHLRGTARLVTITVLGAIAFVILGAGALIWRALQ